MVCFRVLLSRCGVMAALAVIPSWARAQTFVPDAVRINQIFPAGGFTAGAPRADFVELFNASDAPVSLAGWSVQIAQPTQAVWQAIPLSGTIGPRGYYLVQTTGNAALGTALPTPDAQGNVDLPFPSGKVGLVSTTALIAGRPPCPFPSTVKDFVGYGTTADARTPCSLPNVTLNNAPTPTTTMGLLRACGGNADSGSSASLFSLAAPTPRNTMSPPGAGLGVSITPTAPTIVASPGQVVTISATVSVNPCIGQTAQVTANLSAIGGSASQAMTAGTGGVYSTMVNLGTLNVQPGAYVLGVSATATGAGTPATANITLFVRPPNDDCTGAITVDGAALPVTVGVNNDGAQPDADPGACTPSAQGDNGVWFRVSSPAAGTITVDELSAQDVAIAIYTGECAGLSLATCSATESASVVASAAGATYRVLVVRDPASQAGAPPLSVRFSFTPAAAPNDTPCTATALTAGAAFTGSTAGATSTGDGLTVNCGGAPIDAVRAVWFSFTPAAGTSGLYGISTCGSPVNTNIAVFTRTGCPGVVTLTQVPGACDVDSCAGGEAGPGPGTGSTLAARIDNLVLPGGHTYLIRLNTPDSPLGGAYRIVVTQVLDGACCDYGAGTCALTNTGGCPADQAFLGGAACTPGRCEPNRDECISAPLTTTGVLQAGSTAIASTSSALDTFQCGSGNATDGRDVFFRFKPATTTVYDLSLCGSDFDTILGVHTGCPATLANRLICNDDASPTCPSPNGLGSHIGAIQLDAGKTYFVRVSGYNGATGSYQLRINSTGVCCRGSTCTTVLSNPALCAAGVIAPAGYAFYGTLPGCNGASLTAPCCHADFNKTGGVTVQDVFDYMTAWFGGSALAVFGGDGTGVPVAQDLFNFMGAWFAGGCP